MAFSGDALFFDFDGVLADTEPLIWKAWARILAPYGIEFTWDDYLRLGRGATDEEMLSRLPGIGSDTALLANLQSAVINRQETVRRWCSERSPIAPSTVAMLRGLDGFAIGLVTSSRRSEVEPILDDAGVLSCFNGLVCAEDCLLHKPDPAPYLLIRERLQVERGIAFEDSEAGLASAAAAGLRTIRVSDPSCLPELVAALTSGRKPPE